MQLILHTSVVPFSIQKLTAQYKQQNTKQKCTKCAKPPHTPTNHAQTISQPHQPPPHNPYTRHFLRGYFYGSIYIRPYRPADASSRVPVREAPSPLLARAGGGGASVYVKNIVIACCIFAKFFRLILPFFLSKRFASRDRSSSMMRHPLSYLTQPDIFFVVPVSGITKHFRALSFL